jgi:hypothetical protein
MITSYFCSRPLGLPLSPVLTGVSNFDAKSSSLQQTNVIEFTDYYSQNFKIAANMRKHNKMLNKIFRYKQNPSLYKL